MGKRTQEERDLMAIDAFGLSESEARRNNSCLLCKEALSSDNMRDERDRKLYDKACICGLCMDLVINASVHEDKDSMIELSERASHIGTVNYIFDLFK